MGGGIALDIWYGESGRSLGWRHDRVTADFTPYVEGDLNLDDCFFLDATRDLRTGERTGIPSEFQVVALFYNTSHLPARGVSFPDRTCTTASDTSALSAFGSQDRSPDQLLPTRRLTRKLHHYLIL